MYIIKNTIFMKFFKRIFAIGFASMTLVSCGSKPTSISCDTTGSSWFVGEKVSYSINKNKIQVNTGDPDIPKITIPIDGELIKLAGEAESIPIKFEDSSLVFKDVDLYGSIPLDSCPINTPDVLEGLIVVYAMAEAFSEMGQY